MRKNPLFDDDFLYLGKQVRGYLACKLIKISNDDTDWAEVPDSLSDEFERAQRGVYYTHIGLVRIMLTFHLGRPWYVVLEEQKNPKG